MAATHITAMTFLFASMACRSTRSISLFKGTGVRDRLFQGNTLYTTHHTTTSSSSIPRPTSTVTTRLAASSPTSLSSPPR
eukprot:3729648-Amphidinium_carterae.1